MGWKRGPLPEDTYGWGGIVREDRDPEHGFEFASFVGDHVQVFRNGQLEERVEGYDIAYYNNDIQLPVKDNLVEE